MQHAEQPGKAAASGTAGEGSSQLNREKSQAAVLTAEQPAAAVKRAAQPPVQIGSASCGKRSRLWDDASNESQRSRGLRENSNLLVINFAVITRDCLSRQFRRRFGKHLKNVTRKDN